MHINKFSFRVRYGETDQMGVVYHGNYAQYLEIGRVEWLRSLGFSYKSMEESGVMLPVISLHIDFKKSATYDDEITVITKLKNVPAVRIEFDFEIRNQHDELLVLATTVLVFMDIKTKRPIKCPSEILERILSEGL